MSQIAPPLITCAALQSQKAVTASLKSKQLPPVGFVERCIDLEEIWWWDVKVTLYNTVKTPP